jgi:hypothetical protein
LTGRVNFPAAERDEEPSLDDAPLPETSHLESGQFSVAGRRVKPTSLPSRGGGDRRFGAGLAYGPAGKAGGKHPFCATLPAVSSSASVSRLDIGPHKDAVNGPIKSTAVSKNDVPDDRSAGLPVRKIVLEQEFFLVDPPPSRSARRYASLAHLNPVLPVELSGVLELLAATR